MAHPQQDDDGSMGELVPVGRPVGDGGRPVGEVGRPVGDKRAVESAGPVLDAELVTDEEYEEARRRTAVERAQRNAVIAYRSAKTVVTHDRTKTVARHTLAYPVAGVGVVTRRWRDAHGAGRYERQMRAAEAAGDQEALRYWQEADVAEKERRHRRVMDWIAAPAQLIKAVGIAVAALVALLLVIGIIVAAKTGNFEDIIGPIAGLVNAIAFVIWFFSAYGAVMLLGGTAASLFYLYSQGRKYAEMPSWIAAPTPEAGDVMDEIPDERMITNALRHTVPALDKALKAGWKLHYEMPPMPDGKGWRTQVPLPPAAPVVEFVKRKTMLAHNLRRFPIEVWPTEPRPAVLDLWVAKPGTLSGPVDPWPLLEDLDNATADYFKGVPAGVTIKGDVVNGRLFEANHVYGGMMGSGKSSLAITEVCGAMLDPLVEIDVVVMAVNADYEPMKPRLRSLVTGAGDETVKTCLTMLYALYEEVSVRGNALLEHDARAVTRELAEKDDRLRPRIMVIDECQNLFIGEHGKAAIEVAIKLMSTARKYAITLFFLTPEPSKDALPRKLISVASNKGCFAIGDHQANDAVLGSGSYKSGISAVGLTPKTDDGPGDVGTCMQRGFTGKPGLLRTFFLGQDDVHRITERALDLRDQRNITGAPMLEPEPERDPLADIATVLGDAPRMKTMDVLQRLVELHRSTYQDWNARTLTAFLVEHEAEPYKTEGAMQVSAARIREALTVRDENMVDDPE